MDKLTTRTYTATIEITKPYGTFHQPWVYEHSIEEAVRAISGHTVKASVVQRVGFFRRLLKRLGW